MLTTTLEEMSENKLQMVNEIKSLLESKDILQLKDMLPSVRDPCGLSNEKMFYIKLDLMSAKLTVPKNIFMDIKRFKGIRDDTEGYLFIPYHLDFAFWSDSIIASQYLPKDEVTAKNRVAETKDNLADKQEAVDFILVKIKKDKDKAKRAEAKAKKLLSRAASLEVSLLKITGDCPFCGNPHYPYCKKI